ncbi:H+-transporting two-sector ATPase, B/B' subunit [Candidatus Sulfopaludibacter sp. SbA6]|nr:H+-transporting two-sector ATPase, B/B' subunit [Candidatus Sulfopaludibacter sp. SbA6]
MDATLHQLGEILLRALPTFLLVVLLHFYLKIVFFKPMRKVLQQRYDVTEGARKLAEQSLKNAAARTAQYEAAMRAARAEVYQAQEQIHKQLQERETTDLTIARHRAEAAVREAREQLAKDVESAKMSLERDSDMIADQIAESILRRSAA